MSNATKNDTAITTSYSKAITSAEAVGLQADTLRRLLKESAEETAAFSEQRRREHDQALYDLAKERQDVRDGYAREDAERAAYFAKRDASLREAEDEVLTLLGVTRDVENKVPAAKIFRAAFEQHIKRVDAGGEGRGRGMAKAEYETQKRIDVAEATRASALLEQQNKFLTERNQALERQNAELLGQTTANLERMKDLAARGLDASAGIQGKANEAMASAATAGANSARR